jgi:hypothetical protein
MEAVELSPPKEEIDTSNLEKLLEPYALQNLLFPFDISLEDARQAIAGRAEFSEKIQEDLLIFNYKYCNSRTFPDPKRLDGLIISSLC